MEDEDDDFYAPEDTLEEKPELKPEPTAPGDAMDEDEDDAEEEEEEEEDDESDSDIEIVTEQKEPSGHADASTKLGSHPPPPPPQPLRAETSTTPAAAVPPSTATRAILASTANTASPPPPASQKPGSSYPAVRTSTLDIDGKPTHSPSGKPITSLDIDTDLPDEKSWRIPGSDQTDYFNYGFDEFTWAAYCLKQSTLRAEAKEQKKALGEFQNMFGGGGSSSSNNTGAGSAAATAAIGVGVPNPQVPNMMAGFPGDIPAEMVPAMQAMMASGMDPSQMDMAAFMQMMGGVGGGGGGGNGGQGFGGQGVVGMGGGGVGGGGFDAYGGQGVHGGGGGGGGGGRGGRRGRGRW